MRTLLDERLAPITSAIGFLDRPAAEVAGWVREWWSRFHAGVAVHPVPEALPAALTRLEPLTVGAVPRLLVVEVDSPRWGCALFDGHLPSSDVFHPVAYLARTLPGSGLAVRVVPNTHGLPGVETGRLGAVQFELTGPLPTGWLNYVRSVSVTALDPRPHSWRFRAVGTEQWFEEVEAYRAPVKRDRFTSAMLERYCRALDLEVFDPATYRPMAYLVERPVPAREELTLAEAQWRYEIVPGQAATLPG